VKQLGGNDAQRLLLCKCDLTTDMVKEFTDLQGIVGGLYARAQGESEEVARRSTITTSRSAWKTRSLHDRRPHC
jgi:glycyl-tRNA synthetase beta subunit